MDRLQIGVEDEVAFREKAGHFRHLGSVVIDDKADGRGGNQQSGQNQQFAMLEHVPTSIDYVTFLCCTVAARAKFLLEYLLERYHAGYVSPDKALAHGVARRLPLC